ncbi:hypothetical protein Dimus_006834 [Dionaea muscipula]
MSLVAACCLHTSTFLGGGAGDRLHSQAQLCPRLPYHHVARSFSSTDSKRMVWLIKSSGSGSGNGNGNGNGNGLDPLANNGNGTMTTRLVKTFQTFQGNINAKLRELRKDAPTKLLSFLVGFYSATAFATVIGQTGDWDILSAALAVAVVEGIGALMYKTSGPFFKRVRSVIVVFNFWKAGLSLGLFLDSFKY